MTEETHSDLPMPFLFYRSVLNGDHLHFGLWPEDGRQVPMEEAQARMFEHLSSLLPDPPAEVLDVGCGLGLSAFRLADRGYGVTAISPYPEMTDYARRMYGRGGVEFRALGFLDGDETVFSEEKYDALFFLEAVQHLRPLEDVMKKARRLLKDNGVIVIGDEVCYDRSVELEPGVHPSSDFTVSLSENGFKIAQREELGKQVYPTCEFMVGQLTANFEILASLGRRDLRKELLRYLEAWKRREKWYAEGHAGYEVIVAKKDPYFIRPYATGDENTILPMFNRIFYANRSMDHWYWKFRDNPYRSQEVAIAVAFSEGVPLAAHYAGYPVPFYSAGEPHGEFIALQIGDTMTSPSVRNVGLGKTGLLARTSQYYYARFCENEVPFIYGFNTGNIKKLGMRYLGYVYISPVTYRVMNIKERPLEAPSVFRRLLSNFSVDEVTTVDAEWDSFFSRISPSYRLLVKRGAEYLKWRYLDCPDRVHRIFSVRRKGKLIGWSVFTLRGKTLIWGDALFDNGQSESLKYLLYSVVARYFPDIETIEGWFSRHPAWWSSLLEENGFIVTPEPNDITPCFVIFGERFSREKLENNLYYTWGDSDLF